MSRNLPPGIFKTKTGYRVFVRLSRDTLKSATFPRRTTLPEMKHWRDQQRQDYRDSLLEREKEPPSEGFTQDAETYLKAVAHMPTYLDRKRQINWWIAIFGERPREEITGPMIAAALSGLHKAANTVNHHRTALAHLWRVLDGKTARNPVREVPRRRTPDAEPRGLSYAVIRHIFKALPETKTKARLMVMAWTGIPPAQLKTIAPADIDLKGKSVYVRGRLKGKGTKGRRMPLTPEGVAAFKRFIQWEAFGWFTRSGMREAFTKACREVESTHRIDLTGVRPYDLRHSFGTQVYAASGDIRATQILMGHSKPEMTHRYTLGAVDEQVGKALTAFTVRTTVKRPTPKRHHRRKVTR